MRNKFFIGLIILGSFLFVSSETKNSAIPKESQIVINDSTPKIKLNIYGRDVEFWIVELNNKKYIVSMTYFGCYSLSEL